jgi:transcriptional regulator with XRE-family HTH domain
VLTATPWGRAHRSLDADFVRSHCEHTFVKPVERDEARRLRRNEGKSVKEIARLLDVSPSSVSRWTADITLSPGFIEALRQRNPAVNGRLEGTREQSATKRAARLVEQERGRDLARSPTRLHLAGCMLYWAEGSKNRNVVRLTNSDPDLLALFVRFLRECYSVRSERMTLSVNCRLNNGLELAEIERWWLERLGLPAVSLRKATVNAPSRASRWYRNVLIYGTARVTVCSTAIVQSIYGAIQEYAGIERPEWVDGHIPSVMPP